MWGKAHGRAAGTADKPDHPRLCGEKGVFPALSHLVLGSPPPMRGKAVRAVVVQVRAGITPAYAGKSQQNAKCVVQMTDHPRLCGEKFPNGETIIRKLGSPPPMRGKVMPA